MLEFICLFFPTVFCLALTEKLSKKQFRTRKAICLFATECLAINFLVFSVKKFVFKSADAPLSWETGMTVSAAFNFIVVAVVASVIVAYIVAVFLKKADIKLEKSKYKNKNEE